MRCLVNTTKKVPIYKGIETFRFSTYSERFHFEYFVGVLCQLYPDVPGFKCEVGGHIPRQGFSTYLLGAGGLEAAEGNERDSSNDVRRVHV